MCALVRVGAYVNGWVCVGGYVGVGVMCVMHLHLFWVYIIMCLFVGGVHMLVFDLRTYSCGLWIVYVPIMCVLHCDKSIYIQAHISVSSAALLSTFHQVLVATVEKLLFCRGGLNSG